MILYDYQTFSGIYTGDESNYNIQYGTVIYRKPKPLVVDLNSLRYNNLPIKAIDIIAYSGPFKDNLPGGIIQFNPDDYTLPIAKLKIRVNSSTYEVTQQVILDNATLLGILCSSTTDDTGQRNQVPNDLDSNVQSNTRQKPGEYTLLETPNQINVSLPDLQDNSIKMFKKCIFWLNNQAKPSIDYNLNEHDLNYKVDVQILPHGTDSQINLLYNKDTKIGKLDLFTIFNKFS